MSRPTAPRSALLLHSPVPSPLSKSIHCALLGAVLILPLSGALLVEPAWGQSAAVEHEFAIAAGSLEAALNSFAATAGVSVSFSPEAVRGRQSAG
ncbi:MAG TPA: TonB-dependent siderophore receptor, partial [Pseudomonas sp.]|nr:TonB-dependent siderophore receptor [Pseudomonas sp.]